MKKYLLFAPLFSLFFFSCQKDEPVNLNIDNTDSVKTIPSLKYETDYMASETHDSLLVMMYYDYSSERFIGTISNKSNDTIPFYALAIELPGKALLKAKAYTIAPKEIKNTYFPIKNSIFKSWQMKYTFDIDKAESVFDPDVYMIIDNN